MSPGGGCATDRSRSSRPEAFLRALPAWFESLTPRSTSRGRVPHRAHAESPCLRLPVHRTSGARCRAAGHGRRHSCQTGSQHPLGETRRASRWPTPGPSLAEQLRSLTDVHREVVRHSGDRELELTDLLGDGPSVSRSTWRRAVEAVSVGVVMTSPTGSIACVSCPALRFARGTHKSRPRCGTARAHISRPGADTGRGAAG